jgi:glycerophosphoryl diester phosphodiesterase
MTVSRLLKFSLITLIVCIAPFAAAEEGPSSTGPHFIPKRIAHAGGGLGKLTYTNSYQALESNLEKGFEYFEIDFVFTSDGHLVCLHDWGPNFQRTFDFAVDESLPLSEFQRLVAQNSKFTNCTLEGLAEWMRRHPTAHIVTDVRGDNLQALRMISTVLEDSLDRVIPQIYRPRNFHTVRAMGYGQLIWTLYRYRGGNEQVVSQIEQWSPPLAITMPKKRAQSLLPTLLSARGIPTYVHTINSEEEMNRFIKELGVKEIYTDFLAP